MALLKKIQLPDIPILLSSKSLCTLKTHLTLVMLLQV